jgi:predicted membrane protein
MGDFNPHQFRDELTDDIRRRMRRQRHMFRHRHRQHSGPGGIIVGTTILLVGVLFLLENFGLVHAARVWQYWPVLVMAWGVAGATHSRNAGGRVWGVLVAIAGAVLLLGNLKIINENVWKVVWPLFLIGIGLILLIRTARRRRGFPVPDDVDPPENSSAATPSNPTRAPEPGRLDEWAVFGGSRRLVDTPDFKGGEAFAMFGGVELDLRYATITQAEVVIDASALFGGVDIRVPESWNVSVEGHGIFGGYEDQTLHATSENARPRVVVTGSAVFGGVVIKN